MCAEKAINAGYTLFGLEYGNECWGGYDETLAISRGSLSDSNCGFSCPGYPSATCGGDWAIELYRTGGLKPVLETGVVNGRRFAIYTDRRSWARARETCMRLPQGNLATFT
ncbi:hypothetical protein HYH03_017218 [Edaphochlamys debaryana]|uniref:WSC domain-containing protein n=1 Tax=Edaphochlamys debaryana TaxID=47281 RepID=A0A836BQU8_9CHLO|nr:hypothetical protein HYH03_017218 [Edaphochlamys debaryana]|eukprot:KAG2483973.1 hypothetical protein HYH03_017218 [Edaphochlamys debaryana]